MDPLPIAVRVQIEGEHLGERVRITAQVEGDGEAARAAAAELPAVLSAALVNAVTKGALPHSAAPGADARSETPLAAAPAVQVVPAPALAADVAPALMPEAGWVARNRARLNVGFGGVLLALAMLIPMLVPADQRREMLIMTILFGLTGALLLFTAGLPSRSRAAIRGAPANAKSAVATAPAAAARPARSTPAHANVAARSSPLKAWSGLAIGLAFVLAGLLAPFALGATTADERFLIMLGFAPISVIGFFLIAIFWRNLPLRAAATGAPNAPRPAARASTGGTTATRRAPASRVPDNMVFRGVIPIAIGVLVILLAGVVLVLIVAALASAGR